MTMKPSLVDYICHEKADIFKEQDEVDKINKLFVDLKSMFDQMHFEPINFANSKIVHNKTSAFRKGLPPAEDKEENSILKRTSHQHSPRSIDASTTLAARLESHDFADERSRGKEIRAPNQMNESDPLRLTSISAPTASPRNRPKNDSYRLELLQQIEEKQKRKQLEIERERAVDEELEKKIAQQRLSMYLDYLDERKKGNFISKCKPIEAQFEQELKLSGSISARTSGHALTRKETHHPTGAQESKQAPKTEAEGHRAPSKETPDKDNKDTTNILVNLNEVRQIMQHDHIEMLEKLLELYTQ